MKFEVSIDIDAPIEVASAHFANRENQHKWFPDLKEIKVLEGEAGQQDCKSLLKYSNFEIVETVLHNRLPDEFLGDYETPGICRNTMKTEFTGNGSQTTCRVTVDYTELNWFLKFMSVCMPWTLKGAGQKVFEEIQASRGRRIEMTLSSKRSIGCNLAMRPIVLSILFCAFPALDADSLNGKCTSLIIPLVVPMASG